MGTDHTARPSDGRGNRVTKSFAVTGTGCATNTGPLTPVFHRHVVRTTSSTWTNAYPPSRPTSGSRPLCAA
jgi:hypothetical protein